MATESKPGASDAATTVGTDTSESMASLGRIAVAASRAVVTQPAPTPGPSETLPQEPTGRRDFFTISDLLKVLDHDKEAVQATVGENLFSDLTKDAKTSDYDSAIAEAEHIKWCRNWINGLREVGSQTGWRSSAEDVRGGE